MCSFSCCKISGRNEQFCPYALHRLDIVDNGASFWNLSSLVPSKPMCKAGAPTRMN